MRVAKERASSLTWADGLELAGHLQLPVKVRVVGKELEQHLLGLRPALERRRAHEAGVAAPPLRAQQEPDNTAWILTSARHRILLHGMRPEVRGCKAVSLPHLTVDMAVFRVQRKATSA